MGINREEWRDLSIRVGDYNRSLECQGGDQSNEGHGHRLSCSKDEKHFQWGVMMRLING